MELVWPVFALGLIIFSACLYLFLRYLRKYQIPNDWKNLSMAVMSLIFYSCLVLVNRENILIPAVIILAIAFCALFFSYLANKANLKSMDLAANPGYALTFSKSYVVFTYFVSFFLFGAEFQPLKAIAMLLILVGMYVITGGNFTKKDLRTFSGLQFKLQSSWIPLAIYSFFGWGLLSISSKLLFQTGLAFSVFFFYLSLVNVLLFSRDILVSVEARSDRFPLKVWGLLLILGIFNIAFNFCNFYGIKLSPNVGYINAANAGSMGIITVFAGLLFRDELNWRKGLGILLSISGVMLLVLI